MTWLKTGLAEKNMTEHRYPREEIARRGDEIYEPIREEMESKHDGKVVAIDVDTGFYSLGNTVQNAVSPVRRRTPMRKFGSCG